MHEQKKIAEAEYFLGRMRTVMNDPVAFKHELSAFLSAARSVLQYALAEAERSNPLSAVKTSYAGQVTESP